MLRLWYGPHGLQADAEHSSYTASENLQYFSHVDEFETISYGTSPAPFQE